MYRAMLRDSVRLGYYGVEVQLEATTGITYMPISHSQEAQRQWVLI